jgi:hypothetical protein
MPAISILVVVLVLFPLRAQTSADANSTERVQAATAPGPQ